MSREERDMDGMKFASSRIKLTLRGKEFWVENYAGATFTLELALLALEDERIDAIFRALNLTIYGYETEETRECVCIWPEEPEPPVSP